MSSELNFTRSFYVVRVSNTGVQKLVQLELYNWPLQTSSAPSLADLVDPIFSLINGLNVRRVLGGSLPKFVYSVEACSIPQAPMCVTRGVRDQIVLRV